MITTADWEMWRVAIQIGVAVTLVIGVTAAIAWWIPQRRAAAHERLWRAALYGLLAAPLAPLAGMCLEGVTFSIPVLPPPPAAPRDVARSASVEPSQFHSARGEEIAHDLAEPTRPDREAASTAGALRSVAPHATSVPLGSQTTLKQRFVPRATAILSWIWLTGVLCGLFRIVAGGWASRWLIATAAPLDSHQFATERTSSNHTDGKSAAAPVLVSSAISRPLVVGIGNPRIILPADALTWLNPRKMSQVLTHESAHILRRDPLIHLLQVVARTFYWPHPLVYWMNSRLHQAREDVCDNFVLASADAIDYAETPLRFAECRPTSAAYGGVLGMLRGRGPLERRIAKLLDSKRDLATELPFWRCWMWGSALVLVLGVCSFARLTPQGAQADESPKTAAAADKKDTPPPAPPATISPAAFPTEKGDGDGVKTATVSGRVVLDEGGTPVADADVTLLGPPVEGRNVYLWPLPLRRTKTDTKGEFRFSGLAPGRYRVWAARGRLTSQQERLKGHSIEISQKAEAAGPVELRLKPGVRVNARVKAKSTGQPLGNAVVHLRWSDLDDFRTDQSGQAVVEPLIPDRWFIEAWADGYAKSSEWLNLQNGRDAETEFQLEPGGTIEGTVRDPAGAALIDVGINALLKNNRGQPFSYVKSDAEGRYLLPNVPLDSTLQLLVSKEDYVRAQVEVLPVAGKTALDVTLAPRPRGGSIEGSVVDDEDRPIANAELTNDGDSSKLIRQTTTDAQGHFKLQDLYTLNGITEVVVRAPRFAPTRIPVETDPAQPPRELKITLARGHRISGRVVNAEGAPLEAVNVYFAHGNRWPTLGGKTVTDREGRFQFDSLPANCPFTFQKLGYSATEKQTLPLDQEDPVEIIMKSQGVIRGEVLDAKTGMPLRTFTVTIIYSPQRTKDEPSTALQSDWVNPGQTFRADDGKFVLSDLVMGMPLQVTVEAEGYERAVNPRVVAQHATADDSTPFRLTSEDLANLSAYRVRLTNAAGEPVVGAEVRLIATVNRPPDQLGGVRGDARRQYPFNWEMIRTGEIASVANVLRFSHAITDATGQFVFSRIPKQAEAELVWWRTGIPPGRRDHLELLTEDERKQIEIRLPLPARVTGTVDRKVYPQVGGLQLISRDGLDNLHLVLKPGETKFEFRDVAHGKYHVILMAPSKRASPPDSDFYENRALDQRQLNLEAGAVEHIKFGAKKGP